MKHLFFLFFCLPLFRLSAQDIEDPSARKPYNVVVQTGIALQWFDAQFKSFTISAERPLNLYNHAGIQANFFFPNNNEYYYYRTITGKSFEVGVFAKSFFHGRLTGRRSNSYIGPDMRLGRRVYLDSGAFGETYEFKAATFKFLARLGWQYHLGPAVFEITLPIGFENEKIKTDTNSLPYYYYYQTNNTWFIMAPAVSIGIGL